MTMIRIWAHRGASGYAPENTLESFELAVKQQADGIELDVQLTGDGEIVVVHDEALERVCGQKGWVKDRTLEELKGFNFNAPHPEGYERVRIPLLSEVYELIRPTGLTINVELKTGVFPYPGIEEKVLKLTEEFQMKDRVLYSSFNHFSLRRIKELDPEVPTGLLYSDNWIGVAPYARDVVGVSALHPALYHLQEPDYVRTAREHGLETHVWTVNEPEHLEWMGQLGVEAVITNYPDRARDILSRY